MMSESELIVLFVTIECMSNYREHSSHMKTATVRILCMALTFLILRYTHPFLHSGNVIDKMQVEEIG